MTEASQTGQQKSDTRPRFDVLVEGRPSVDLTFLGLKEMPHPGEEVRVSGFAMNPGASFINVHALTKLGLRTGFITDLGNDFFSRYVAEQMRVHGMDDTFVSYQDRDLMEVSVGISFPTERTFITWDADRYWRGQRITPNILQSFQVRALFSKVAFSSDTVAEAKRKGIPILMDSFWDEAFLSSELLQKGIDQADVFLPNLLEALTITHTVSPEAALAALQHRVKMVAIKLGPHGALGSYEGRVYEVPVLPTAAVDTTGAGDNFDAGFTYGLLHDLPFVDCLRCGVVAGSLSTTCAGGVAGSPTEAQLLEGLDKLRTLEEQR